MRELGPPPSLRYLDVRSLSELTVGDVRQLLTEYSWLSRALGPAQLPDRPVDNGAPAAGSASG